VLTVEDVIVSQIKAIVNSVRVFGLIIFKERFSSLDFCYRAKGVIMADPQEVPINASIHFLPKHENI
jgi:hypothetical protein